jgi:hypothetical protein
MAQRNVNRDMPQLSFRASFDVSKIDVEKRTVPLIWTTGARVLRSPWFSEPYLEELSLEAGHVRMERLESGTAPLLNAHSSYDIADVIGVVESARLEKAQGTAIVRFDTGPDGEEAFRKVRERILRNVSVGYRTYKMQKVEGGDTTTPVYRAVDWEPYEISMVPIGADAGAVTRSGGGMTNPCEFIQERDMPDPVPPTPTTPPTPTVTPAAPPQPTAEQRAEIARLERERTEGIRRIGGVLKRSDVAIVEAINNGTTLEAFRAAAVDALADAPPEQGGVIGFDKRDARITAGADQRDKYMARTVNWLIHRAGAAKMVAAAAEKNGEKIDLDPGESRGMTLVEIARDCLERSGVRTRGMDVMQMIGLAFTHRANGAANSASDFPILLENTLHKFLLAAYTTTPDTWRRWCVTGTVTDFRAHNRYRQGSLGVFDDLPEGAEYKNATIPDGEKQSITAGTKGRIIAITRQTIINDDMGALNDIATRLGRAGALTIEVAAYASLLSNAGNGPTMGDGNPLFHATHGNIGAGGAALTVATVDADRVLMGGQQDPAKNELLELRPAILLLPLALGGQARVINMAQYDVDKVANARNQEPNKVAGLYRDIVDTARLTGTVRYSFADPSIAPVFEVAFLNGIEQPFLELQQGWRVDGTEYKARLDFGVAARDWRGVVRNPGV